LRRRSLRSTERTSPVRCLDESADFLGVFAVAHFNFLFRPGRQSGRRRRAAWGQPGARRWSSILLFEGLDLALTLNDQTQATVCTRPRKGRAGLCPTKRRHLIADQPVQDPARLLRVHQVLAICRGLFEGFADRPLGDFVERHALMRSPLYPYLYLYLFSSFSSCRRAAQFIGQMRGDASPSRSGSGAR